MFFIVFFLLANFAGLMALFTSLALWRRESVNVTGWLVSRRGLGAFCVLAAGACLLAGAYYKAAVFKLLPWPKSQVEDRAAMSLIQETLVLPEKWDILSPNMTVFLVACLALLAVGAALLAFGSPARGPQPPRKGVFAWSAAVALIIALAELSALQFYNQLNYALFLKGIPRVKLDTAGARPHQVYNADYQFRPGTDDYFLGKHPPVWGKALEDYKGKPNIHYLEVGLFEGQSVLWMLENVLTHPTARLTGIDPFLEDYYAPTKKPYKDVFYSNLKRSGSEKKATVIEGFSQVELRKLPLESFDIIYIDGSHAEADVLEDAILSWRLLRDGGVLIFDDYPMHRGRTSLDEKPGLAMDTFFAFFGNRFEIVHVDWQVILKKKPKN